MSTQGSEPEVFEVLRKIRYDLTAAQGKLTDALTMLSAMNLPSPDGGTYEFRCRTCDTGFKTERVLAFHNQNVHGGPAVPLTEHEMRA